MPSARTARREPRPPHRGGFNFPGETSMNSAPNKLLNAFVRTEKLGPNLMRIAIAVVFLWIGFLKFAPYEADSITPFVANSPVMSFFYAHPDQYAHHLTHEGELKPAERAWQTDNDTYAFSKGLGTV